MSPWLLRDGRRDVAEAAERTQTCGFVTMLAGMRSFTLIEEIAMASEGLRMVRWLGRTHPIVGSDGGPTMLMDFDADDLTPLFPTRHTARERELFLTRLRRVQRDGVLAMEAFEDGGMLSVSAPVRDAGGGVVAAACLVATMEHASPRLAEIVDEARRLAARLSTVLRAPSETDATVHPPPDRRSGRIAHTRDRRSPVP